MESSPGRCSLAHLYKGIEGEEWRELYDAYKEMSRAVGVEKPQGAQKAEALQKMKAARDAGEEYYVPVREDNILGRNKTRLAIWEEHLKDPIVLYGQSEVCGKAVLKGLGPKQFGKGFSPMAAVGFLRSLWEKPIREGV